MNAILMHARDMDEIRPPTNDQRRADWASKYFGAGYHREPSRIGTYRSKRGPVPGCPQPDEFDERTPTITQRAGRIAGKESSVSSEAERYAMEKLPPDVEDETQDMG